MKTKFDLNFRHNIIAVAEMSGKKIIDEKDELRTIVELHMVYESENDQRGLKNAKTLYSRDVAAIRGLISRNIPPSQVLELSKSKGEGLDAWSRAGKKRTYRKPKKTEIDLPAHELGHTDTLAPAEKTRDHNVENNIMPDEVACSIKFRRNSRGSATNLLRWDKYHQDGTRTTALEINVSPQLSELIEAFYDLIEDQFPDDIIPNDNFSNRTDAIKTDFLME